MYSDESVRGAAGITEDARPGMHQLLAHIERGDVDQVFAEATSRLAREPRDMLHIHEIIQYHRARLVTIPDGAMSAVMVGFKSIVDAHLSKSIADHVKRGQRAAVKAGRTPGGIAFGYSQANTIDQNGRAIRGLRVIHAERAAIVTRIFEKYAANVSPKRIAEYLNEAGIPGPRGQAWKASTIYGDEKRKNGILQNRIYIGQLVLNRTSKALHPDLRKERIRPNPESEWIVQDVPALRIISDELWEAVKTRRAQSAAQPFRLQRRPRRLLSGLGYCAQCGGAWIVIGDERWGCTNRRNGGGCKNNRSITTKRYEERVLGGLQDRMLDPALVNAFVKEYHAEYARRAADQGRSRNRLERRLLDVERQIANLVAAIASGGAAFEEIKNALAKQKTEQARIRSDLQHLDAVPVVALHPRIAEEYRAQVKKLAQALSQDEEARHQTNEIVRGLIDRVLISPSSGERGVNIEVSGRLASIISLATGKEPPDPLYAGDGAGSGNRTRIASLEGWSFTTKLYPHYQQLRQLPTTPFYRALYTPPAIRLPIATMIPTSSTPLFNPQA